MPSQAETLRMEGVFRHGFGIVPKLVMHDPELSLESKAIYAYLCALAGGGEQTFPYRETILRQLGISKNAYYRHYKPLLEQGYIRVERPDNRDGANIYVIVSNPKRLADTDTDGDPRLGQTGLKSQGYGVLPRDVMTCESLSVKAKGLYAYLCSYCGAGSNAFPLREHILFHLDISEPTYYKALSQLRDQGYLHVSQRKTSGQFGRNDYFLNEFPTTPDLETPCPRKRDIDLPPCPKNGDTKKWDTKNGDTRKGDAYLITVPSSNKLSIISPSTGTDRDNASIPKQPDPPGLAELARQQLPPEIGEQELTEFLVSFRRKAAGKQIGNLPAYIRASLQSFALEKAALTELGQGQGSYRLGELEAMIDAEPI